MNLLIMTLIAVLVGLTTMGAMTWAYVAEDRAARRARSARAADQPKSVEAPHETRERISA